VEQRISIVTLGVSDLAKSQAFFERLGWKRSVKGAEGIAFVQVGGIAMALYPGAELARDAGVAPRVGGFSVITLAYNARTREEVDAVLAEAVGAGATLQKPAQEAFWGGYSGYFADLDGYLWEVAWNPSFSIDSVGNLQLPE
jgi:predicted lactoylglutathione lyase